jgi:hypothetical protein
VGQFAAGHAVLQDYVSAQSIIIGCCHATVAMCALTAISGAIHHQFAVKMMRNGDCAMSATQRLAAPRTVFRSVAPRGFASGA